MMRALNALNCLSVCFAVCVFATNTPAVEHPGLIIYREKCSQCHGEAGRGTDDYPDQLSGSLSINQLAAYIDKTMPEGDPSLVTGEAARHVAEAIHAAFYSTIARERMRPVRPELSRLTVRQMRMTLADLVGSFREPLPTIDSRRGLRAKYYKGRDVHKESNLVFERTDPQVQFDFGLNSPAADRIPAERFSILWTGSLLPPESGRYEFFIHTGHSAKLYINQSPDEPPLIDASIQSGSNTEFRTHLELIGGRPYPLRLEFSKANQGVNKPEQESSSPASIELLWKPPHGVTETIPERCLLPVNSPASFVLTTPFPPDDASLGYERGTRISPEWFRAATSAAVETAGYCLKHIDNLGGGKRNAVDREEKLKAFAATLTERAFRRPLTTELRERFIDKPFAAAPDRDTGLKRALLLTLTSPRFLYREPCPQADGSLTPFDIASRLSFGLWDSLPDDTLVAAANKNQLDTPERIVQQANRMLADQRARAKLHDFFLAWLRIDQGPEVTKDRSLYADFSPAIVAAMRTSLSLLLDEITWSDASDFRRLFTHDEVFVNGTLAPFFGLTLPTDAPFQSVRLDDGKRAGLLTHPYTLSVLAYADATSPIHRGVFLARSMLGNVLKPPPEAVAPLAAALHPSLTTRERVAQQTKPSACQTCHTMINPLGFALEDFDAVGRFRTSERRGDQDYRIDASGSYQPRAGEPMSFNGGQELGASLAGSRDAAEAFVQNLFHAIVKQPIRAWGDAALDQLVDRFIAGGYSIRLLIIEILLLSTSPATSATVAA